MDDGWFGKRNDDNSSLGDWFVNKEKLPNEIKGLADGVHARGLKFGIWVEPEMVNVESELYRAHPDWILHVPDYQPSYGRHQLILDLSRSEVREYVLDAMRKVFSSAPIDYVKWDMNRHMTEAFSAGRPFMRLWKNLLPNFPTFYLRVAQAAAGVSTREFYITCRRLGARTIPMRSAGCRFRRARAWRSRLFRKAHMFPSRPTIKSAE